MSAIGTALKLLAVFALLFFAWIGIPWQDDLVLRIATALGEMALFVAGIVWGSLDFRGKDEEVIVRGLRWARKARKP